MSDLSPIEIDQNCLERLVDGELDPTERREAISRLAREQDGWRRCALAFLEAQSIRDNLRQLLETSVSTPNVTRSEACDAESSYSSLPRASVNNHQTLHRGTRDNSGWQRGWIPWLSLSACVLLAFTWGRFGNYPADSSPPATLQQQDPTAIAPALQDSTGGTRAPSIVSYQPHVDLFAGQSAMPADIEQQLRGLGIRVQRQHGLMPVMDGQGNRVVVPYEDVNFVPVNREL